MAKSSVAICTTVRDCGTNLKRNIPVIENLRLMFKHSIVIAIENDSVDDTKSVLLNWQKSSEQVRVISSDYGVKTILQMNDGSDPSYSNHRISKMAYYRNKYMEELKKETSVDYVIIADLDLEFISIEGIANSFGQPNEWHAITANGIKRYPLSQIYKGYRYFDTFAFSEFGDNRPRSIRIIQESQTLMKALKPGMPMFPVRSAFGGLAIYRYNCLMSVGEYYAEKNIDPLVHSLCEHTTLHDQMRKNGFDKIYINPSQIVIYETYLSDLVFRIRRFLLRRFGAYHG